MAVTVAIESAAAVTFNFIASSSCSGPDVSVPLVAAVAFFGLVFYRAGPHGN
jgi:hypothetical protein